MVVKIGDRRAVQVQPGMSRVVLSHSDQLMLVEVSLQRGVHVAEHAHSNEQVTYVIRGCVRASTGGETVDLTAGESCLFPSGQAHAVEALENSTVLDAFAPQREEFL